MADEVENSVPQGPARTSTTSATRSKRSREKKKNRDPEAYREWERMRKREKRAKVKADPAKLAEFRRKEAERQKARYAKKKAEKKQKRVPEPPLAEFNAFPNKQALSRSINAMRQKMPDSSPKQVDVLVSFMNSELSSESKEKVAMRTGAKRSHFEEENRGRPKALGDVQQKWLLKLLERPDIVYTSPKRDDAVPIGKNDEGKVIYKSKRYLRKPLEKTVDIINKELATTTPEGLDHAFRLSYGVFQRFIKTLKWVKFQDDIPTETCTCDTCENLKLCIAAAKSVGVEFPSRPDDLIKAICCDPYDMVCLTEHQQCGLNHSLCTDARAVILPLDVDVNFYKWGKTNVHTEKILKSLTPTAFVKELESQIETYSLHHYKYDRQHKEMRVCLGNLDENSVAIQVDYAERYANQQQSATQSAYFGQQTYILYTCCVWERLPDGNNHSRCFCIVSDGDQEQSKFTSTAFNSVILERLKLEKPELNAVHFWSDGCAAQFRSKYVFAMMGRYPSDLNITWNFFETSHGKGCIDGIGGTVKRTVFRNVKTDDKVVLSSAKQFADYANKIIEGVEVMYVGREDVDTTKLDEKFVKAVPETLQIKSIHRTVSPTEPENFKLDFFRYSTYGDDEEPFTTVTYNFIEVDFDVFMNSTTDGPNVSPLLEVQAKNIGKHEFFVVLYETDRKGTWYITKLVDTKKELVKMTFMHPPRPRCIVKWPTPVADEGWVPWGDIMGALKPEDWPVPVGMRGTFSLKERFIDNINEMID